MGISQLAHLVPPIDICGGINSRISGQRKWQRNIGGLRLNESKYGFCPKADTYFRKPYI